MNTYTSPKLVEYRLSFRVDELAQLVGVSSRFIRDQIKAGELQAHKVGTNIIILTADANRWITKYPICSNDGELDNEGEDLVAA